MPSTFGLGKKTYMWICSTTGASLQGLPLRPGRTLRAIFSRNKHLFFHFTNIPFFLCQKIIPTFTIYQCGSDGNIIMFTESTKKKHILEVNK